MYHLVNYLGEIKTTVKTKAEAEKLAKMSGYKVEKEEAEAKAEEIVETVEEVVEAAEETVETVEEPKEEEKS